MRSWWQAGSGRTGKARPQTFKGCAGNHFLTNFPNIMGVSNNLARHEKSNWFTTTHWTVVVSAKSEDESQALEALDGVCRTYWAPVHAFVRSHGRSPEDADDLTQQFFARFLEKEHYKLACPERGRFRSFLLTSVRRFLVNEWERASAQKRGGSAQPVSLNETHTETDGPRFEPIEERTAADVYDQCWIISLLGQVRELALRAFGARFSPDDWAHALGGWHVVVR